ncbi:TPA: HK97-gp10 family putative phage morphogenesis protein [Staphylococcus pseudintermedius]
MMKITGVNELKRVLKNMSDIDDDVNFIMTETCKEAPGIAVKNARAVMVKGYWTGNLAREIESDMLDSLSFMLISNAAYSGFVEYGTRYMQAEPFMRPTSKQIGEQLRDDFMRLLKG